MTTSSSGFPIGYALVTVFTNGIPSQSQFVVGTTATPGPTPAAPVALKETHVTNSSFTANWKSVSDATGYRLDVATDSSFANYVPGYQDLDVGNVTSRIVTGVAPDSLYYYRLRAYNGNGTSPNSNVNKVKTKK
jgi:hypothetical protein